MDDQGNTCTCCLHFSEIYSIPNLFATSLFLERKLFDERLNRLSCEHRDVSNSIFHFDDRAAGRSVKSVWNWIDRIFLFFFLICHRWRSHVAIKIAIFKWSKRVSCESTSRYSLKKKRKEKKYVTRIRTRTRAFILINPNFLAVRYSILV